MTYEELKAEVERLPVAERLRLVREVSDSVHGSVEAGAPMLNDMDQGDESWREEFEAERAQLLKDVPADSSLHRILGIARTRKQIPMTKEEDREAILEYLTEKYLR